VLEEQLVQFGRRRRVNELCQVNEIAKSLGDQAVDRAMLFGRLLHHYIEDEAVTKHRKTPHRGKFDSCEDCEIFRRHTFRQIKDSFGLDNLPIPDTEDVLNWEDFCMI
jgi:hypothetical protein